MNANDQRVGQQPTTDPEELSRLLEIELIQKRAEWQRTTARNKGLKSISLLFLFIVVLAGLAAAYFAFTRASEGRRPPAVEPGSR